MRKTMLALAVAAACLLPAQAAVAAEEVPVDDLIAVDGLSADQLAAIQSFVDGETVGSAPTSIRLGGKSSGGATTMATGTRRASYYRGSALMWTRDNVDFGYDWSRVTWTSPFQQAGWIFPNIARNGGISMYYDTATNDRFRALNTIGAGIPTPWGDVKVYSTDYVHRLSVYYNGAWSAWSD